MDHAFSRTVGTRAFSIPSKTKIKFPKQKLAIFRKVKEIKELRGGVQMVRRTRNYAD
jgi:hypothetical protein